MLTPAPFFYYPLPAFSQNAQPSRNVGMAFCFKTLAPSGQADRWVPQAICLFVYDLQHHSGSQTEAVLEQQAFCHVLKFTDTVQVLCEQFSLRVRERIL